MIHVALVAPEIHWNTGNAGRTCLAAGAKLHLVGPIGFSLDAKQVRRAGLDYWARVEPVLWRRWEEFAEALPSLGAPWLFSGDGERTLWEVEYPEDVVLVFGKESTGLPARVRDAHRERLVRIPMEEGSVRSINVSTCVGIAVYEVMRRRQLGLRPRE